MMYTERISLKCQIVQSEENIVSDMDGEKVMLNVRKGKYYNLGETGGNLGPNKNSNYSYRTCQYIVVKVQH